MQLRCRERLLDLNTPVIMGVLNVTPDSFSDGGLYMEKDAALRHCETMLKEGATIIDVGGYSSRPGAPHIPEEEELKRVTPVLEALIEKFPEALFSIDTFRYRVAKEALELGVHIINDISAGRFEPKITSLAQQYHVPFVVMHMQGTPQTMQKNPHYENVIEEIFDFFVERIQTLHQQQVYDIILDPGFGFGKTWEHNKILFSHLEHFTTLNYPLLIGISRKSWIQKMTGKGPLEVVPAMCALHWEALKKGVRIFRVHDVEPMKQVLQVWQALNDV